MRRDILRLCDEILNGNKNVRDINETIIVLIPKMEGDGEMAQFRPISLCRLIYKIFAKVLANHLKCRLPSGISQNQSAFVPF